MIVGYLSHYYTFIILCIKFNESEIFKLPHFFFFFFFNKLPANNCCRIADLFVTNVVDGHFLFVCLLFICHVKV